MANKKILGLSSKLTRQGFEHKLTHQKFEPVPGDATRRTCGRWLTYKDASIKVPGRVDCFCKEMTETGITFSAPTWSGVARIMQI